MKKLFLTLLAVVMTTAMFAQLQRVDLGDKMNATQAPLTKNYQTASLITNDASPMNAHKRSRGTELYYYKPAGTLYQSLNFDGWGYSDYTVLIVPPSDIVTYENMSKDPTTTKWYVAGMDYTSYADDEGNLSMLFYPDDQWYYSPVLYNSAMTQTYEMQGYNGTSYTEVLCCSKTQMEWLGYFDDKQGYVGGVLDNGNTMGTGTYTDTTGQFAAPGAVLKSVGIIQQYPAPASTLYVDSVYVTVASHNQNPLKNGAELKIKIYDGEGFDYEDESTWKYVDELSATADDFNYWYEGNRGEMGMDYVYWGTLNFKKLVEDPIFGPMSQPITLKNSFACVIDGFADNSDIEFCPWLYDALDCDGDAYPAYMQLYDAQGDSIINIRYYTSADNGDRLATGIKVALHSIMDGIQMEDSLQFLDGTIKSGYCILRVPAEGGSACHSYNYEGTDYDIEALYVETVCPWYDENGNENYYAENAPDWVESIICETDDWDAEDWSYVNWVYFDVDPLPSGVTGRTATFRLVGRGVKTLYNVCLIQGDADIPEGIEAVAASTATPSQSGTYSIAGQRVGDNARGIVIKDGKKVLNK